MFKNGLILRKSILFYYHDCHDLHEHHPLPVGHVAQEDNEEVHMGVIKGAFVQEVYISY